MFRDSEIYNRILGSVGDIFARIIYGNNETRVIYARYLRTEDTVCVFGDSFSRYYADEGHLAYSYETCLDIRVSLYIEIPTDFLRVEEIDAVEYERELQRRNQYRDIMRVFLKPHHPYDEIRWKRPYITEANERYVT